MNELMEKYRLVFGNPVGQAVLADILRMTHFGETLNSSNPQQIGEYNVGIAILAKMGVLSRETQDDVIRALQTVSK
ncbi:MAG: hypothetical protein WCY59_08665 [Anaerovoracaceae bacterium]